VRGFSLIPSASAEPALSLSKGQAQLSPEMGEGVVVMTPKKLSCIKRTVCVGIRWRLRLSYWPLLICLTPSRAR